MRSIYYEGNRVESVVKEKLRVTNEGEQEILYTKLGRPWLQNLNWR